MPRRLRPSCTWTLAASGFRITPDVAGIPTAFMAEWGDSGPVIAFLGEYDALSGLNQQSGALVCTPSVDSPGLAGHGCGHHLLGTSAHFAAVALQAHLLASGQRRACATTAARPRRAARARPSWRAPACSTTWMWP
jgi:aminobenzoyl-glutamate utilization protein B